MKFAIVLLALSAAALVQAGPFGKNTDNQINSAAGYDAADQYNQQHQPQQYSAYSPDKTTPAIDILKQWCFASQLSHQELTASFKKLVGAIKANPTCETTEAAVMSARICHSATGPKQTQAQTQSQQQSQQQQQQKQDQQQTGADPKAAELIKDVYMDALIACQTRDSMKQLTKIVSSNQVDSVRASYYMTRLAVTETDQIKDDQEIKQIVDAFVQTSPQQEPSEAVERQKMFAASALVGKQLKSKQQQQQQPSNELKQLAEELAQTIVNRYIKPVSSQEVQQYMEQSSSSSRNSNQQSAKKVAKRNAALKALANIPGQYLKEMPAVEQTVRQIAQNKQEQTTARQSAIECLEQNDKAVQELKQIAFDQQEPIEVRVAAYRAMMTAAYAPASGKSASAQDAQSTKQQAAQIVDEVVKHCEQNQQNDDQFVSYVVSHLENLRTSQQPEHKAVKECIQTNKQHSMQIQLLAKKLIKGAYKQQQQQYGNNKQSRNYKLEQSFNQIDSGLVMEGDLIYESEKATGGQKQVLPKVARVNMSMPIMGETVNVIEVTLRQNEMDDEIFDALKVVSEAKLNGESVSKMVESFAGAAYTQQNTQQNMQQQQQQQQYQNQNQNRASRNQHNNKRGAAEADMSVKVDGVTVAYVSVDDFKSSSSSSQSPSKQHQRNTRSANSLVEQLVRELSRNPINFNRGFNFNVNQRLAKLVDLEANVIAGLRFESAAKGSSSDDFEIVARAEPRFAFEAIVGPSSSPKKLMQRVSTKSALAIRYRYKYDQVAELEIDLPMNTMDLFTAETQMVTKSQQQQKQAAKDYYESYEYLPESIYGQQDIYYNSGASQIIDQTYSDNEQSTSYTDSELTKGFRQLPGMRKIFGESREKSPIKAIAKLFQGKQRTFAHTIETSEKLARATGLRGKLRLVASPKDTQLLVQAVAQKYDNSMKGYRVQLQTVSSSPKSKQYVMSVSTPNSRIERTMQVRLAAQQTSQRTLVKAQIVQAVAGQKVQASGQVELVHDGREFGVKAELASEGNKSFRHALEAGVQRGGVAQSGRVATTYKPYLSIVSSELKRPIQLQGALSYQQQSPKTVISYELKSPQTGDFVSGKMIVEERVSSAYLTKRGGNVRRSMRSPLEIIAASELTVSAEMQAQIADQQLKAHKMLEWDAKSASFKAELSGQHKDSRQNRNDYQLSVKLDAEKQAVVVQRQSEAKPNKSFRLTIGSVASPSSTGASFSSSWSINHQLAVELRYAANLAKQLTYKQKVELAQVTPKKIEVAYQIEASSSEARFMQKIQGQTKVSLERKMKQVWSEISAQGAAKAEAKLKLNYASPDEAEAELQLESERVSHRTTVRSSQRQFVAQSTTAVSPSSAYKRMSSSAKQQVLRVQIDAEKQQREAKLAVELPSKEARVAADLKWGPTSKQSSIAVQTRYFSSSADFSLDFNKRAIANAALSRHLPSSLRFKTNLKDLVNKEAYWLDSALNNNYNNINEPSYLRLDSPFYRSELKYEPRQQTTKFNMFARNKASKSNFDSPASAFKSVFDADDFESSPISAAKIADKLWVARSILSGNSNKADQVKERARRALFEYADRKQQQKHLFEWEPRSSRLAFNLQRSPSEFAANDISPLRLVGDFDTTGRRQSSVQMESELADLTFDANPFDMESPFAKVNILSRNPRSSGFKKHESEVRYDKKHNQLRSSMKHQDANDKMHQFQLEADAKSPRSWAKMAFESDKHGKANWEHKWRKPSSIVKRTHDNQDVYANHVYFERQSPADQLKHRSHLQWQEPTSFGQRRQRRSIVGDWSDKKYATSYDKYSAMADYLKQLTGKVQSQTSWSSSPSNDQYSFDLDYSPIQSSIESPRLRMDIGMPDNYKHTSTFHYEPSERLYKLQSKTYNRLSQKPEWQLSASNKQRSEGPFTASQDEDSDKYNYNYNNNDDYNKRIQSFFMQPVNVDYSDKYGRQARFDYDLSPMSNSNIAKYAGLRQKRAAIYYKDVDGSDFEHKSSYDFYPETLFANKQQRNKYNKIANGPEFTAQAMTKYGPVMVKADSDADTLELTIKSPAGEAKLTAETPRNYQSTSSSRSYEPKLVKLTIDTKQQTVPLYKIVRQTPIIGDIDAIKELAKKLDQGRFEHQTEMLMKPEQGIFKIKSQSQLNQRPMLDIEAQLDERQERLIVKLSAEGKQRSQGQLVVDLASKNAELIVESDGKRTIQHQTRLVRLSDKYYQLESSTAYKQKPLAKVSAKLAVPWRRSSMSSSSAHISTFEGIIYKPEPMTVTGSFDSNKNQATFKFENERTKMVQEARLAYDEDTQTVLLDARLVPTSPLSSANSYSSSAYQAQAEINLPGLYEPRQCVRRQGKQQCQSKMTYSSKHYGDYAAKYVPTEMIAVKDAHSNKQHIINLSPAIAAY